MTIWRCAIAAILTYMAVAVGHARSVETVLPNSQPEPPQAHEIDLKAVEYRINRLMRRSDMVGMAVAIIENGEITYAKGFGETVRGSGDKVTEDTVFRWASVSKGVAAAAFLDLSEEGHFGLTSPVMAHAASLKLPDAEYPITVEDVLTHSTGIVRNAYDTKIEAGEPAKLIRTALGDLPRLCQPGECYTYQNVAYDAVAEMIEAASGLPYKSVIKERFFDPLDMKTASLTLEGLEQSKSWAKPHNSRGYTISKVKPTYYRVPGAAGVNSSVTDLAKWVQAQIQAGNGTISSKNQAILQTPRLPTPSENRLLRWRYSAMHDAHYGLGWRTYEYDGGHQVVGHRGAVEGYRASVLFDTDLQTGVAVLWNSNESRPSGLPLEIMDQVYGLPRRDWMRLN